MFIEQDKDRIKRFLWSGIFVIIIAYLAKSNSLVLSFSDSLLEDFITAAQTNFRDGLMTAVSFIGEPKLAIVYTVILAFLLWGFKYKIPAMWALGTVAGGDVVAYLLKEIVKRARPIQHLKADDGYSFPSGHVFGMFLVIAIIFIVVVPLIQSSTKRFLLSAILVIFLIILAISRVYLFAHHPSDTIGAILLAYAWLQVSEWLYVWLAPILKKWKFVANSEV